jgi:hypothetical protein
MLAKEEEVDVEVLWEDQQKINEFGRLNTRLTELRRDKLELKVGGVGGMTVAAAN